LDQNELAARIGLGEDTLSKWKNDRLENPPRRKNMAKLAVFFGYPVDAMVAHLERGDPLPWPPNRPKPQIGENRREFGPYPMLQTMPHFGDVAGAATWETGRFDLQR